jgi:AraC-like DNA-binding protein
VISLQLFSPANQPTFGHDTILQTSEFIEVEELINRSVTVDKRQFTLLKKRGSINIDLTQAKLDKTSLYGCKFGNISVNVKTDPIESAHLIIPLEGSLYNHVLGTEIGPGEMAFFRPGSLIDIDWLEIQNSIVFSVSSNQMEQHFNKHIEKMTLNTNSKDFLQKKYQLIDPKIAGLVNVINTIHIDSLNGRSLLNNSRCRISLENMLMECVNALIPSHEEKSSFRLLPGKLKIAIDYIEKNKHRPVSVTELTGVAGCGRRSLENSFQLAFGMGPSKYISQIRMHAVRKILETTAAQQKTVANIAADWGYYNLSYFSKLYHKQFGETPACTLKKRKRVFCSI